MGEFEVTIDSAIIQGLILGDRTSLPRHGRILGVEDHARRRESTD